MDILPKITLEDWKSKMELKTLAWAPKTVTRFKWKTCREERNALWMSLLTCSVLQHMDSAGWATWGFPPWVKLLLLGGVIQTFSLSDLWVGSFFFHIAGYLSYLTEKLLWQNAKSSCSGLFLIYCRWKIRTHFLKIYVLYPCAVLDRINGSWQTTGH